MVVSSYQLPRQSLSRLDIYSRVAFLSPLFKSRTNIPRKHELSHCKYDNCNDIEPEHYRHQAYVIRILLLLINLLSSITFTFVSFFVHLALLVHLVRVLGSSALGGEVLVLSNEQHSDTPTNTCAEYGETGHSAHC